MFCSVCGAQNPPQQRFCRSCGKPLSSAETLAADADDPLKTRLSIPTDQSAFKTQPSPPPPPQHVDVVDNMATVVGMPAVKIPTPGQNASTPDPFATQVGGGGLNLNQLKELAAKSTAGKVPSPPQSEPDNMATVVGMQAVKLPTSQPSTSQSDDAMKTVVGPPKGGTPSATKEPVDNMATVVGMSAISADMLPKAPEAAKQPTSAPAKAPAPPTNKPALPETPKTPSPTTNNSPLRVEQESSSNSTMLIMIGVVVVVLIIIAAVVFLRKP